MDGHRVLIVEGSRAGSMALTGALARDGYVTHCVRRGSDGLRAALSGAPPDLVLVGARLPDQDGLAVVRALKDRLRPQFVPMVVLARDGDAGARVCALRAGADDCFAAEGEPDVLSARVAALLRIKAAHDALRAEKEELERLSITDALTGLFNRRYFQYRLHQEVERSHRHGGPVALLLLDLDHFKRVNDRHGHAGGDVVLRATADVLTRELRRLDVCTRWGGEEFAIIMPNTGPSGAATVADRVLGALRAHPHALPLRDGGAAEPLVVTGSIGLACYPAAEAEVAQVRATASDADALLHRADAALYRAKDQGRDRTCAAWDPERSRAAAARLFTQRACA